MVTARAVKQRSSRPLSPDIQSSQTDMNLHAGKVDPDITQEVMRRHKTMTKTFVIPGMSVIGIAWWFVVMQNTPFHYALLASGIVVAGLNAWLTSLTESMSKVDRWRSDALDATRWILTLAVYDLYLQFATQSSLATLSMVWTGLMIGAQADLYSQRFRRLTLAICGASGLIAIFIATPEGGWREKAGAAVTVGAIVWLFGKMQDYWANDLIRRLRIEKVEAAARSRLQAAEKNAQIGMQARTIAHELGNLIQNLELNATNPGDIDRVQLTRSLYFIKRINKIVLRDIDQQLQSHVIRVQDLLDDVNLLLRPDARALPCRFEVQATDVVRECQIEERPGALFLIIQNLVRNSIDAIAAANLGSNNGFISLKLRLRENEVCIDISDNGVGMSETEMRSLFRGERESSQAGKHGLGFLFVQDEAARNRVSIKATSKPDFGTTFHLKVPVVN